MSIKTDREIKEEAQKLAKRLGFPLGTIINAFLRQFIREKTVIFSMEPTYRMSKFLERELKKVEKDIKKGKNMSPPLRNADEIIEYLDKAEI